MTASDITSLEVPPDSIRPEGPVRDNAAWRKFFEHEERMARALRPPEPSYTIEQKSPAGKTPGFEFTISHPDPDECERKALEWAEKFPAPQPAAKS